MILATVEVVTAEELEKLPEEKAEMIKQFDNYERASIQLKGIDFIQENQEVVPIVLVNIKECKALREIVGLETTKMFFKRCSVKMLNI